MVRTCKISKEQTKIFSSLNHNVHMIKHKYDQVSDIQATENVATACHQPYIIKREVCRNGPDTVGLK